MSPPPLIVGNEEHRFLMLDQLRELKIEPSAVLLEPVGRNTAPALTLAALQAMAEGGDPVLVMAPADQTVTDLPAFTATLRRAVQLAAEAGRIVILGITPDRAGNRLRLHPGGLPGAAMRQRWRASSRSPTPRPRERYLAEGGYYWNSGMFVLRASVWLAALKRFRPDIDAATRAAFDKRSTDSLFVRPGKAEFAAIPAESIDYAVMEKCAGPWPTPASTSAWCRWRQAGTTSAPGTRCGRWQQRIAQGNAAHRRRAVQRQPQLAGARHEPPRQRGRRCTTWWSSRPPTRCW